MPQRSKKPGTAWRLFGVWLMMLMLAIAGTAAHAALPPAGTTIGNQAAATYTDSNGSNRNATSNKVITVIQQVAALDLVDDRVKQGAPNGPVYFPHTVTNNGNGPDSYTLTAVDDSGAFTVDQIFIYADANGDGVPDNFIPLQLGLTPTLAAGASFSFVVAGHVPATATTGQVGKVKVEATSVFDITQIDTNNDTVTVTPNAIIDATKAINTNVGTSNPQTTHTYTLSYENRGVGAATTLTLTDKIDLNLTYLANSGKWNSQVVTDGGAGTFEYTGASGGVDYSYDSTTKTVTAIIANVAPGQNGTVSFDVTVNANIAPQVIPNKANFNYNNGVTVITDQPTNTVNLIVNPTVGVTGVSPPTQGPVPQGSTLYYNNVFTNTGTGTDTFNVAIDTANSTFPTGTTFKLYQQGTTVLGGAPLLDSNNDNIPDTGPVLPSATYTVVLQVTLPASASGDNGGAGFTVDKIATSITDPTKKTPVTDKLTGITPSTVDLKNPGGTSSGGDGTNQGPEGTPVNVIAGAPGSTLTFNLSVTNSSAGPDNYDLLASGTNVFSPNTTALPAGATVVFSSDLAGNSVITNTGNVAPGATANFFAQVKIPVNASPVTAGNIYYRATSPNSGALDTKLDAITVNTLRAITIIPNHTGQTYPGSSIVYSHTVTNNSNIAEDINLTTTDDSTGFTSLVYWDQNGDGVLDASDPQITGSFNLPAGGSRDVFVKVFAPANAVPGNVDVTDVKAETSTAGQTVISDIATDTTTIVSGQLTLLKEQALDYSPIVGTTPTVDGTPDIAYTTQNITANAIPGAGIRYKITVTNNSALPINSVVVNDSTPPYTTYFEPNATANATGRASWTEDGTTFTVASSFPASGSSGVVIFTIGTLNPGQSVTGYFEVKINQ